MDSCLSRESITVLSESLPLLISANSWSALANPFVLLGEIEQWFRRGLDVEFTSDELAAAGDVGSAANLTIGELKRIVESQAYWERLGWAEDRGTFVEALERVRKIRDGLMHFGPDPLSDSDADHLRRFRDWLEL